MQSTAPLRALVALLFAGSLLAAQGETKKPAAHAGGAPAPAAPVKQANPKEASVAAEPAVMLRFSVTGLSKDNEAKVKETLTGLTAAHYVCDACKVDQAAAGKCPKCSAPLTMKEKPLLQTTSTMADQGSVSVTVAPGNTISYSMLENTLGKNAVHIDPAKFPIPGKAELIVRGGTSDNATALQKAFQDAKLFDDVRANFDAAKSEIHLLVKAGTTPPTRAKVLSVLEATGTNLQLGDVVFGSFAPPAKA